MPTSSWSTMSDLLSLNLFSPKTPDIYLYPDLPRQNSSASLVDSLKDAAVVTFLTPLSSPAPLQSLNSFSPSVSPASSHSLLKLSPSLFLPSMSSPILVPSFGSLPNLLRSHPLVERPSLLDSSASFVNMMKRTELSGSPSSFLSCSSGWDAGVVCEAVALPSLLHTSSSLNTLGKVAGKTKHSQEPAKIMPKGIGLGLGDLSALESGDSFGPISQNSMALATTVYLSRPGQQLGFEEPSTSNKQYKTCISGGAKDTMDKLYSQLHANEQLSPYTSSPASDASSINSSIYEDPFHWDLVLAALDESPDLSFNAPSDFLPTRSSSPLLPRHSISSMLDSSSHEEYSSSSSEPELTSASSTSSVSDDIPTIIVMNPEFVSIPVQASISSIVGLYGSNDPRRLSLPAGGHHRIAIQPALTLPIVEEEVVQEADAEGGEEWWSDNDSEGDSYDESEFEIVAVSSLRTRLETILEEDEAEEIPESVDKNCKLPTPSIEGNKKVVTSASLGAAITASMVASSSSWTASLGKVSNSGTDPSMETASDSFYSQASRRRHFPNSSSATSTVRLVYAESSVSSLNHTMESGPSTTTEGGSEESQWLFYVHDGAVLEIPVMVHSTSASTTNSKMARKLASFPNVPTSPILSPFPSPLPSSTKPVASSAKSSTFTGSGLGLSLLDDPQIEPSSFLSPYWVSGAGPSALPSSTMLGLGLSGLTGDLSPTPRNSLDLAPIKELLMSSPTIPTPPSSPSRSSRVARHSRHVHFESADFRPVIANIPKTKYRSVMFSKARRACFRKRKVYQSSPKPELPCDVRPPPIIIVYDRQGLSSSFSSPSIVGVQDRRRHGAGRVRYRRRLWNGCRSSVEVEDEGWDDDGQPDDDYWETRARRGNENEARRRRNAFYGRWRRAWL